MNETIKQLHLASQYLSVVGLNFLEKAPDDSQSNLKWDELNVRILSREFGVNDITLALNVRDFSLSILVNQNEQQRMPLSQVSHADVLVWLNDGFNAIEQTPKITYTFHYELPYEKIDDDYVFSGVSASQSLFYETLMTQAQRSFESLFKSKNLASEIRIWPHHFDLGFYTRLSDNLFIGGGLAIPDSVSNEMYYYASGWLNGMNVNVKNHDQLSIGDWKNDQFIGGVLPASASSEENVIEFYSQAIEAFTKL